MKVKNMLHDIGLEESYIHRVWQRGLSLANTWPDDISISVDSTGGEASGQTGSVPVSEFTDLVNFLFLMVTL